MDKFADIVEKTVVILKDNSLHADLGGGTLYGIVVEKLPENSLKQYYRWVKEQEKNETMETLNEWVASHLGREIEDRKTASGLAEKGKATNRLERVTKKEIRSL